MKVFLDTNIFLEDFSRADTSAMEILSPEEFVGKYL